MPKGVPNNIVHYRCHQYDTVAPISGVAKHESGLERGRPYLLLRSRCPQLEQCKVSCFIRESQNYMESYYEPFRVISEPSSFSVVNARDTG